MHPTHSDASGLNDTPLQYPAAAISSHHVTDEEISELLKKSRRPQLRVQTNNLPNGGPTSALSPISSTPKGKILSLDLGFNDITYSVKTGILKRETKTILKGISGTFKAGDLTAIMGPSGAGKSTIMDILAGYTRKNVSGSVTINGRPRDIHRFRKQSVYIMQDNDLQPQLTVVEAMHFAACLKLGPNIPIPERIQRIKQILHAIGLYEPRKTRSGNLSGGQSKRLAIALELISDPPVMFFDEPTSGLDSSISTQVVSLLKKLALEGRTIICTIHQPSALLFRMFDHLYSIAEGECIYTGDTEYLVPFLKELDLKCPESHNPADYLLEISTGDYGVLNPRLVDKCDNGRSNSYRKVRCSTAQANAMERIELMMESGLMTPVKAPSTLMAVKLAKNSPQLSAIYTVESSDSNQQTKPKKKPTLKINTGECCHAAETYSSSFPKQLFLLIKRMFLIISRDKSMSWMRILIHLGMAIGIGFTYLGIGNDASNVFNNFRYTFFSIMFLMYTAFSAQTLAFPLERPIIQREHFNRWYSLKAYYVAMTLADIPIQIGCTLLYICVTYYMTSQPMELYRIALLFTICLLTCFVSQSIGLIVGAIFSLKNGAIFGPFFISPFLAFSGFFVQLPDAHPALHWLFHISFLKHGLQGASLAIFGYDRPKMDCPEMYCHYIQPEKFLKSIDMQNGDFLMACIILLSISALFRFTAFYIISFKLRHER